MNTLTITMRKFSLWTLCFVASLLISLGIPSGARAQKFEGSVPQGNGLAAAQNIKKVPSDLSKILEKNAEISEIAESLKSILEKGGKNARDSEEFLLKMQEFLMLVSENTLSYLDVLNDRVDSLEEKSFLSSSESSLAQSYIDQDISAITDQQTSVSDLTSWEDAKVLGNEMRSYRTLIGPRMRGLAGLRLFGQAKALINRSEKIYERLVSGGSSDSSISSSLLKLREVISSADASVSSAKDIYLNLIELKGKPSDADSALSYLRNAQKKLQDARQLSFDITRELVRKRLFEQGSVRE